MATLLGVGCQPPSFMGRDLCLEFNKSTEVVGNGALTALQRAGWGAAMSLSLLSSALS